MFFIEVDLISVVSSPKGGNQAPSIRIRGRTSATQYAHLPQEPTHRRDLHIPRARHELPLGGSRNEISIYFLFAREPPAVSEMHGLVLQATPRLGLPG